MSAPLFNLPAVPAAGLPAGVGVALGQHPAAGPGGLGGFEALMTAFFGGQGQPGAAPPVQALAANALPSPPVEVAAPGVAPCRDAAAPAQAMVAGPAQAKVVKGAIGAQPEADLQVAGGVDTPLVDGQTTVLAVPAGHQMSPGLKPKPTTAEPHRAAPRNAKRADAPAIDNAGLVASAPAPQPSLVLGGSPDLASAVPPSGLRPATAAPAGLRDALSTSTLPPTADAEPADDEGHAAPPSWGRSKPAGEPAAPALAHALGLDHRQAASAKAPPADAAQTPAAQLAPPPAEPAKAAQPSQPEVAIPALAAAEPFDALPAGAPLPGAEPSASKSEPKEKTETKTLRAGRTGLAASAAFAPAAPTAPAFAPKSAADPPAPADQAAGEPGRGPRSEALPLPAEAGKIEPQTGAAEAAAAATTPGAPAAGPHASAAAAALVSGSPETVANLTAHIIKKLAARTTRFDVQLDPIGLGRVDMRVEIAADGQISAAMSFDNPQAAAELKSRSAELQKALSQAGFDLSGGLSFDVASDPGGSGRGAFGQPAQGGETGAGFRGRAFQAALDTADEATQAAVSSALNLRRGVATGVDVRI